MAALPYRFQRHWMLSCQYSCTSKIIYKYSKLGQIDLVISRVHSVCACRMTSLSAVVIYDTVVNTQTDRL